MPSIAITFNHVRAVKAWADGCDAQVNLDLSTTVSLPLKILMFVLVDGWSLVLKALVGSFR